MAVGTSIATVRRLPHADVARVGLSMLVVALLAGAAAFVGLRLSTPSDGTDVGGPGNPYAAGGVTVIPNPGHVGPSTFRAGDRIIAMFGQPVETWAASLVDPGGSRPAFGVGDTIAFTVERAGATVNLEQTTSTFDLRSSVVEDWGVLVLALSVQLIGIYLFARRPDEPAARALLVAGTGMFASTVTWALGLQASDLTGGTAFWVYAAEAGLAYTLFWSGLLHLSLVFPRPYAATIGRGRLVAVAYGIPIAGQATLIVTALLVTGRVLPALEAWMGGQAIVQVGAMVTALSVLGYSYWRLADPMSRSQLRLVAVAAAVAGFTGLLLWFGPVLIIGEPLLPRSAIALLGLPFPIALAIAVSRHHLFDLDRLLNRSLVYGGLSAGVIATYAVTVALLGGLIPGNAPFAVALLGAGAVATVALPLRDRLQRSVNRLMYGDRDDPDRALRRLGRRLESSLDPQTVIPTLVEAVAEALRSPYVAIELERDGDGHVEAARGTVPVDATGPRSLVRLPMVYRARTVGRLVVAPRAADEPFSAADRTLLADLATQAAPTIEAIRLTADLRRSREEIVAAREEERRRLRRDLHDELGPAMAGSLMKLGAARSLMRSDPARASDFLDDLDGDVREMIEEIRRIAHNLRPPALDEFGLAGVLGQHVAAFDDAAADGRLRVSLACPTELPPLPAAVEVAGLRIALEGLTNVARHSGAARAQVGLEMDGETLVVTVTDDGVGIPADAGAGVGLRSMRERADELGGTLEFQSAQGGGTTVIARLPVGASTPA